MRESQHAYPPDYGDSDRDEVCEILGCEFIHRECRRCGDPDPDLEPVQDDQIPKQP